jgi:hypothetical protein
MENVFCHRTSTDVYQLMAVQMIAENSNSLAQFNVPESLYVQSPQCPKQTVGNRSIRGGGGGGGKKKKKKALK